MTDEFAYLRGAVTRAAAMQREVNELVAPTTDRDDQGSAGVAATASAGHAPTCPLVCCTSPDDPDVVGVPYTPAEFEALIGSVWSLEGDTDPTRFDELLHAALVTLGRIALNPFAAERGMVTLLLRSMEQRALRGPDHPVRQP